MFDDYELDSTTLITRLASDRVARARVDVRFFRRAKTPPRGWASPIFHRRKLKRNVSRNSIANGRATVSSRDFITPRANYARAIRVEEDAVAFVSTPTVFDPHGFGR